MQSSVVSVLWCFLLLVLNTCQVDSNRPVVQPSGLHTLLTKPQKLPGSSKPYNVKPETRIRDRILSYSTERRTQPSVDLRKKRKDFIDKQAAKSSSNDEQVPRSRLPTVESIPFWKALNVLNNEPNPEVDMNTTELVTSKGYPFESYEVVTNDGYILTLVRIPHGLKNREREGPRPAVLLQHGLMGSCNDWLVNPANQSLGFVLADAGADVWLANSRGNKMSRKHRTLDPSNDEFWKFSWDQMAKYDLPACIDFILKHTGQKQIFYVGHSQGTTIGFVQFGEDQKLASKIKHFMALAPVARVANTISTLRMIVPAASTIAQFVDLFGRGEFFIPEPIIKLLASNVRQEWGMAICENYPFLLCGFSFQYMNVTRMDVYLSHAAAGTSTMDMLHWAQGVQSGQFQRFDYGTNGNLEKYGQETPPLYDLKKLKVPVAIFRGGQDWLADNKDVDWLLSQLRTVTHDIYIPSYEHMDFTFGFDAVKRIYQTIVEIVMAT